MQRHRSDGNGCNIAWGSVIIMPLSAARLITDLLVYLKISKIPYET